jgi:hypothetical protein
MEPHASDIERPESNQLDEQGLYALLFLIWLTANLMWFDLWGGYSWRQESWRPAILIGLAIANVGWIALWLNTSLRRSLRAIWAIASVGWIGYWLYRYYLSFSCGLRWHGSCPWQPYWPDYFPNGNFDIPISAYFWPLLITFGTPGLGAIPWLVMAVEKKLFAQES